MAAIARSGGFLMRVKRKRVQTRRVGRRVTLRGGENEMIWAWGRVVERR
jgi:hypothetical protein